MDPKRLPAPVSIRMSFVPVLMRYPLTDVSTGSARNERMSNWSTRVGVVLVRSLRTSSATVPSDRRNDLEIAEHHPVVTGRLSLLDGRHGVRRVGIHQAGGDGDEAGDDSAQSFHCVPVLR